MKKTKIIIGAGIFIIITFFLCSSGESYYEKEIEFKTEKEVVEHLTSNPLYANKGDRDFYVLTETDSFLECLSKRKRYTTSLVDCQEISILKERELDESGKIAIKDDYISKAKNLKGYNIGEDVKVLSYEVSYTLNYNKDREKGMMNLVLIDEGEGYVIDYLTLSNLGGEKHVTGF